jgi:hypothetical protein
MRYLVAVGTLVSSFAMFACGGGDDTFNVTTTVPLTSNTVAAVQNVPIAILDGQLLGTAPQSAATLTFTGQNGGVLLDPNGRTAAFTVAFAQVSAGSCTFNVPVTQNFIQFQTTVTFTVCNLLNIQASNVEEGGSPVPGTLNLQLSGLPGTITSNNVNVSLVLDNNGNLSVVNPVTGANVPMGVQF